MVNSDRKLIFQHIAQQRKLQNARKAFLYKELATKYGVTAREDSRLCRKYIFGENIPISTIAYMLRETDWFHKNTSYDKVNHSLQQSHKDHCKRDLDPFVVKDLFSAIAKVICMDKEQARCADGNCLIYGDTTLFSSDDKIINNFCHIKN